MQRIVEHCACNDCIDGGRWHRDRHAWYGNWNEKKLPLNLGKICGAIISTYWLCYFDVHFIYVDKFNKLIFVLFTRY